MRRCCFVNSFGQPKLIHVEYSRHHVNGFTLFAKELQAAKNVLRAKNFRRGHDNMKIVSQHWRQLSNGQRQSYNRRAREIAVLKAHHFDKASSDFNLLMQLLFKSDDVSGAGDEVFTALMAKNTLTQLKSSQKEKLRKKLIPNRATTVAKSKRDGPPLPIHWYFPDMRYFDSFVEMLRSVAPTQKDLFAAVSRVLEINQLATEDAMSSLSTKYDALSEGAQEKFKPITDEESCYFERYCAFHCATFDVKKFDIVRLFAQYRGLANAQTSLPEPEATQYKMLMEADRFRESLYYKTIRNLERAKAGRSTDHGTYISHIHPDGVPVPPETYSIQSTLSDVEIATMLAETRFGRSVYDDVVERTSCFRQEAANQLLQETYLPVVRETHTKSKSRKT